jgi:hypothetical protein
MSDDSALNVPPFPPSYRASGLLLNVTSLPSSYGIGDVGPAAIKWTDQLANAGQSWWQALPLGPTGYGNSPYQSLSSFAGNGLLSVQTGSSRMACYVSVNARHPHSFLLLSITTLLFRSNIGYSRKLGLIL